MHKKKTSLLEEGKYFAFISYSHKDNKWAKWLHETLEQYRIPKSLVGIQSRIGRIPKRLYPIFRDREELPTSTDLGANIQNALEQSKFLIVICSPRSARSLWVNEEIKLFKSMGGDERILSFIVDGEPNISDKPDLLSEECFPEWLRFKADSNLNLTTQRVEPIAADARAKGDGKRNAFLKIVAGLTGIDYAVLNDREKKRQRRRSLQIVVTISMVLLTIFSIYKIQNQRLKQEELKEQHQRYLKSISEAHQLYHSDRPHLACNTLWKTPENLRNWEWGRLLFLSDPEIADISQKMDSVKSAIFSPNTSSIATVTLSNHVIVWDIPTGKKLCEFGDTKNKILSAKYTFDSMKIITTSEGNIQKVWDAHTGSLLVDTSHLISTNKSVVISPKGDRIVTYGNEAPLCINTNTNTSFPLTPHHDKVVFSIFNQDGNRILTASHDGTARLWDSINGQHILTLNGHNQTLKYAQFSSDGSWAFTIDIDDILIIWDLVTGKELNRLTLKHQLITRYEPESIIIDPKGEKLVSVSDDGIVLWNMVAGTDPHQLVGHTWVVYTAMFNPQGDKIVTASGDGTARIWDAFTGEQLFVLEGHTGPVYSARFSPDGARIVTNSRDQTVRFWDANKGTEIAVLSGTDCFTWSDFSPNGLLVATVTSNGICKLWDATMTKNPVSFKAELEVFINRGCISPDGSQIITVKDDSVRIWNALTGNELIALDGDRFASFDPNSKRILTGTRDHMAILWDAKSYEKLAVLKDISEIDFGVFSPNGSRIATISTDAVVSLWDIESGKKIITLPDQTTHLSIDAFCHTGHLIATTFTMNPIRVYDTNSGNLVSVLKGTEKGSDYPIFNTHGSLIAGEYEYNNVGLWNSLTGDCIARWERESMPLFSPDGTMITTLSKETDVKIRSVETGLQITLIRGHVGAINHINFSPDSKRIITVAIDGTAKIWDTITGSELMTFEVHSVKTPYFVIFSSDGARIVTVNLGSELQVWQAAPYYLNMLPGSDSLSWESRYILWKQQRYRMSLSLLTK